MRIPIRGYTTRNDKKDHFTGLLWIGELPPFLRAGKNKRGKRRQGKHLERGQEDAEYGSAEPHSSRRPQLLQV